jgi:hypothetical protein
MTSRYLLFHHERSRTPALAENTPKRLKWVSVCWLFDFISRKLTIYPAAHDGYRTLTPNPLPPISIAVPGMPNRPDPRHKRKKSLEC